MPNSYTLMIGNDAVPASLDFASIWDSGTGSTNAALNDGGKWDSFLCPMYADILSVNAVSGFPTTNALRCAIDGSTNCGMVKLSDHFTAPAVGEYLYHRIYLRVNDTSGGWGQLHWFQCNSVDPNQSIAYEWVINPEAGDFFAMDWHLISRANESPTIPHKFVLSGSKMAIGTTYRLEVRFHRTDTLRVKTAVRVHEGDSETILYDSSDFVDEDFGGETLASQDPEAWLDSDIQLTRWELGNNGPASATLTSSNLFEVAACAFKKSTSASDWIGPYVSGEAA